MATSLTVQQWVSILSNTELTTDFDIAIFQALYSFENHQAPASDIGRLLGYKGKNPSAPLNLEVGRYAKRIAKTIDVKFSERDDTKEKYWDFFFNGWYEGTFFIWQIKDEIVKALQQTDLTGEMVYSEEIANSQTFNEGLKKTIIVNTYERNPMARQACINYWSPICNVCGFDFEKVYGDIGKGYIHVHHLIPISDIGESYQINPIEDLRPVCPNCHAMLHKKNPPLSIEELQTLMDS